MAALGRIAFSEQDFETAASNLRRAHQLVPENVSYRLNLARIEYQNGNAESAASLLEDEIESTLDHVPSGIMLGTIKAQAGDAESALDIAAELQKRHSSEAAPYAFEGDVHLETGDLVAADKAYDKAFSMDTIKRYALRSHQIKRRLGVANSQRPLLSYLEARPLDYEVRAILAESYMETDDVSKSISTYEKITSEQPGNAVVLNNLAWGYYLADDPRAIETARKARDAMPENGAIVDTLGWILVENGELAEGEALLRKAVEMEQGRPDIQYHHAVALARLERTEEARTKLEKILSGDLQFSGRSDAERLLAEL
jgi:Tfp pilus assembly protein PilF